jgi:predicted membrane-bound spermidine synthase
MSRRHYAGIFALSLATLFLELSLMRVLAVANWYHFGFLVISTALLAFGASGTVLTLWTRLREQLSLDHVLAALSLGFGIVTVASYWVLQHIPFHPFYLDGAQLVFIPLYFMVAGTPFFCSGLAIGLLLSRGGNCVDRLYAADLIGAGVGCALIALMMPAVGGAGSVVAAAGIGFIAASVFGWARAPKLALTGLALAIASIPLAIVADQMMPISVITEKKHPVQPDSAPIFTAWNAFSRVDVFDLPAVPEKGRPDAGHSILLDMGAAGTAIPDLSGGVRDYLEHSYRSNCVPYFGKSNPKVLVIGSGAGREVLEALYCGAASITAVEINPIVNGIVSQRMRTYWGGLFEQPQVRLVTEEGRSFIRRSKEEFDVIISIQTMTDAAISSGALTMSESYLFTKEAFGDFLDHLSTDGVMLITRPFSQQIKLFATIREVFEARGLGNPAHHLISFEGPLAPYGHTLFNTGFLCKKSSWTDDELRAVPDRLGVGHPERWFGQSSKIFYPNSRSELQRGSLSSQFEEVLSAPNLQAFYAAHREEIRPATDDRPFFNQLVKWSSLRFGDFRQTFRARSNYSTRVQPVTEVMLVTMLVQTMLVATVLILFPLAHFARGGLQVPRRWVFLTYFAGLGLGFIMIEIVFIQRFLLFLGQPVYSFAVVLAGLLIFSGIGAFLVSRFRKNPRTMLMPILASLLIVLFVISVASQSIFSLALGLPLFWRVVIVIMMLGPIGILLGMPFPIGLLIVGEEAPAFVPWAWGVNGFFTVLGSIGASMLGMAFGFTVVLMFSGACYLLAILAMTISGRRLHIYGMSGRSAGSIGSHRQARSDLLGPVSYDV